MNLIKQLIFQSLPQYFVIL